MTGFDHRPTALVVEDDDIVRRCVETWLTENGWYVESVPTAEAALVAAHTSNFDIAICDVRLPGNHDGTWLAAQLQTHFPRTQVVYATGVDDLPGSATLRANVSGYLVKPYRRSDLLNALAAVDLSVHRSSASLRWPPEAKDLILARRRQLLVNVRAAVIECGHDLGAIERRLMPDADHTRFHLASQCAEETAKQLGLDEGLRRDLALAVQFSQLGRQAFPLPEDVPGLSRKEYEELVRIHYPLESLLALSTLGLPVSGALVARIWEKSEAVSDPVRASLATAVGLLRAVILFVEQVDAVLLRGPSANLAEADALMRLREVVPSIPPEIIAGIERSDLYRVSRPEW